MIEAGLADEVKKFVDDGMEDALRKRKIVGYAEMLDYFEGRYSIPEAVELIKQHTRNYAKRQMTWFRNRLSLQWVNPLEKSFHSKVFGLIDDYLKRT
jgi:tRNA dimethylallyltransferase